MSKTLKASGIAVLAILVVGLIFSIYNFKPTLGSAPAGSSALIASSTVRANVGPSNAVTLFAVNIGCVSRAITTHGNPIRFTVATSSDSGKEEPSVNYGHFQATSTTVMYDAGVWGCNQVRVFGLTASSTISITEWEGFR